MSDLIDAGFGGIWEEPAWDGRPEPAASSLLRERRAARWWRGALRSASAAYAYPVPPAHEIFGDLPEG